MNKGGRTDRPYSVFPTGEPVAFFGTLIEEKKPKGEFCQVRETRRMQKERKQTLEMGNS